MLNFFPRIAIELVSIFIILLLVLIYIFNDVDINKLIAFLSFLTISLIRLIPAFNIISSAMNNMKFLKKSKKIIINEYLEIKNKESDQDINENKISFDFNDKIELKDVSFKYKENSKMVIQNFNYEIKKGQKIAITGVTGSGKSTLINLITGFLEPTNGKILVDGKSINLNISSWQNEISYIPQDIYLLDESILENITFSDKEKLTKSTLIKFWKFVS